MNGKSISSTTSRNTATPVATAINSSSTNANSAPNPITALALTVTRLLKPEISPI